MTQSADVFTQLREFSWRGIGFPVSNTKLSFEHDQKEHKWPDRDGAHIEPTGRAPIVLHATIPMVNGAAPGPQETWTGPLYPNVFRGLLAALLDRTSGNLSHPELGLLVCVCKGADVDWDAGRRDGVIISATWKQTTVGNSDQILKNIAAPSPISTAVQFGADLDLQLFASPDLPQTPPNEPSFSDSMRSIQAVFDTVTLASAQVQGQINHVLYRVNAISDAAVRAGNIQQWPVINSCERLKSAMVDVRNTLLVANQKIGLYVTPSVLTLSQISITLQANIGDLLSLNPRLAASPAVPERTTVRYYKAA